MSQWAQPLESCLSLKPATAKCCSLKPVKIKGGFSALLYKLGLMSVTFSALTPPSSTVQTITAWASPHNSVYLCVKLTFKLHWWPLFVDQFARKCTFFTFHRDPVYPWQYIQLPGKCDIQTNGAGGLLTQDIANVLHYPTQDPVCPGWGIRSLSAGERSTAWQLHELLIVHSITYTSWNHKAMKWNIVVAGWFI